MVAPFAYFINETNCVVKNDIKIERTEMDLSLYFDFQV